MAMSGHSGMSEAGETMKEAASRVYEKAKDAASEVAERGADMLPGSVTGYIEKNPVTSAVLAVAGAWLVGLLTRSSGSSSSRGGSGRSGRNWSDSDIGDTASAMDREVGQQPIPVLIALLVGYGLSFAIHGQNSRRNWSRGRASERYGV